jgi:hypothetical protein
MVTTTLTVKQKLLCKTQNQYLNKNKLTCNTKKLD